MRRPYFSSLSFSPVDSKKNLLSVHSPPSFSPPFPLIWERKVVRLVHFHFLDASAFFFFGGSIKSVWGGAGFFPLFLSHGRRRALPISSPPSLRGHFSPLRAFRCGGWWPPLLFFFPPKRAEKSVPSHFFFSRTLFSPFPFRTLVHGMDASPPPPPSNFPPSCSRPLQPHGLAAGLLPFFSSLASAHDGRLFFLPSQGIFGQAFRADGQSPPFFFIERSGTTLFSPFFFPHGRQSRDLVGRLFFLPFGGIAYTA